MSMIAPAARKILKTLLPNSARRWLLMLEQVHTSGGLLEPDSTLYRLVGSVLARRTRSCVHTGPFKGMRYIPHAAHVQSSAYCPKLLGTYERELHPLVEALRTQAPYQHIVNIGAGEGYYAIGLARQLPHSRLTAFEADPESRVLLSRMAQLNEVASRITIREFCTTSLLQEALKDLEHTLVVCDVEGGEQELLDTSSIPALSRPISSSSCTTSSFRAFQM